TTIAASDAFYAEDHTVRVIAAAQAGGQQVPAHLLITDQNGLQHAYDDDPSVTAQDPFNGWLRDGVGVIGGAADFYTAHNGHANGSPLSPVESTFAAAYTAMR